MKLKEMVTNNVSSTGSIWNIGLINLATKYWKMRRTAASLQQENIYNVYWSLYIREAWYN